ncbi:methyltransferase [Xenorhabdus bovienii]|uniref:methyltransferase n=1 Tax=Xenorhabdus bovienii TaxID=40576 RepID=UPI00237CB94E|nr:methyltransferase [Xenorhabdus bovienii]MDE1482216.1 SAM-dependent methyltransferase [Xenorhabdus bovienii]MDE9432903.1 SAM-dependent methyltransferase [Xenorhabdus bovienii]MDE9490679.1 SAM-dependent methyltransferase [Xenorhabdus bovienii]MDE9497306.1 SAM-dependent methyltransferase [Xenorhabdus bovienii]MDE9506823.1 SAM-dependent methyltransferase [Xenorhabdus bovienii]
MTQPHNYDKDECSALEAITEAQRIAFAPMLFQTAVNLRDFGILSFLDKNHKQGATKDEICNDSELDSYGVGILLDMGLSGRIILKRDKRYFLSKIGHYLLHDKMTRVNMDFTQDVCYQGLFHLKESLQKNKPAGLKVFGEWPTIYPALSQLPEPAKTSWFSFDHFYSDSAFNAALKTIFALNPKLIYDVGGNTGKWALRCCQYDSRVSITILDLPQQVELAEKNILSQGMADRISGYPVDMLSDCELPKEADIWWMSQFLDCFSETQIIGILRKISAAMKPDARVCIMELFWDCQPFEAAAYSLNATSLYFTCLANGNSRFYSIEDFTQFLHKAGFIVESQIDQLGLGHTLLICKKQ